MKYNEEDSKPIHLKIQQKSTAPLQSIHNWISYSAPIFKITTDATAVATLCILFERQPRRNLNCLESLEIVGVPPTSHMMMLSHVFIHLNERTTYPLPMNPFRLIVDPTVLESADVAGAIAAFATGGNKPPPFRINVNGVPAVACSKCNKHTCFPKLFPQSKINGVCLLCQHI